MPAATLIGGRLSAVLRSLGDAPVPFDVTHWRTAQPLGSCYVAVAAGVWRETGQHGLVFARAPLDGSEVTVDVLPLDDAAGLVSSLTNAVTATFTR